MKQKKIKVSLICTIWNEEENIKNLLESIRNQTVQPEEFIIVDGGSIDKTISIIQEYKKKYPAIKLIKTKNCNISEGRNIAIKNSKNEIIIGADGGGCIYDKNWIKNLKEGFNGEAGFGRTTYLAKNNFQKIMGKKLTKNGNYGSSRNIIFSKKIWKEVGGYPENFYGGEDTLFNQKIFEKGYKSTNIPEALGYRAMRNTYKGLYNQFKNFGYWDGVNLKFFRKVPKKYLIAILLSYIGIPFSILLSPFLFFSISLKIEYARRIGYFIGFHKGLIFGKLENSVISGRKEKEVEKTKKG
jgi:glycosyltransferase involved in cell wall biosynthesis